jgi:hypothetical protein
VNILTIPLATAAKCDKGSAVWNPLCSVTPNPGAWGPELQTKVGVFLSGLWWLVIVGCVAAVIVSFVKWAWASKVSHSDSEILAGTTALKKSAVAFGGAVGASLIITAIINLVQ